MRIGRLGFAVKQRVRAGLLVYSPAMRASLLAMWTMSMLAAAAFGCDPPPTLVPPGPAPTLPPPDRPIAQPDAGVAARPPEPPIPQQALADGTACSAGSDCRSGVCEGEGCGAKQGVCAARNRSCTRDRRPYCGCDGKTFYSSGSCPGGRFANRGACSADGASGDAPGLGGDGEACSGADDCASGICEGQGCGEADRGVCVSKKRRCTADLRSYCGCDGVTFQSSGSCPGRRYSARAACTK